MKVQPSTIAIKLNKAGERAVKQGHPWVFENSITKGPSKPSASGSLCVLFDRRTDKPFAFGLWDAQEIIRIKIIYQGERLRLNDEFWLKRLQEAFEIRSTLLKGVNGYRAIHGENDGFPGLVLDIYDKVGVLKVYSEIWRPYLDTLIPLITQVYGIDSLVFRLSRKLSENNDFQYKEGDIIGEELESEETIFNEYGVKFYAYPISGHKTGFFLDQRPNRYWVQQHAEGKSILDVFSYVGGFGIHGLKGGAESLTLLDISAQAMEVAKKNIELNELDLSKWNPVVGNAFEELETMIEAGKKFDIVVLDPPSFAKQNSEVEPALKQYTKLAELGANLTKRNGYLVLGSCSSRISLEAFQDAHRLVLNPLFWEEDKIVIHDVDHPITYAEGVYLKTIIYRKLQN